MQAMSRCPASSPDTDRTASSATSRSCRAWRAGPTKAAPALVSVTPEDKRSKRRTPSSRSTARTAWDTAGWEWPISSAAAVKLPRSATATTAASWRNSITSAYYS